MTFNIIVILVYVSTENINIFQVGMIQLDRTFIAIKE